MKNKKILIKFDIYIETKINLEKEAQADVLKLR